MQRAYSLEKTLMLGKTEDRRERGMMEDKMVGWHPWLNRHDFEQAPGDGEGQGSLPCCSPPGGKELDMTEWLNNNKEEGTGKQAKRTADPRHCWRRHIRNLHVTLWAANQDMCFHGFKVTAGPVVKQNLDFHFLDDKSGWGTFKIPVFFGKMYIQVLCLFLIDCYFCLWVVWVLCIFWIIPSY